MNTLVCAKKIKTLHVVIILIISTLTENGLLLENVGGYIFHNKICNTFRKHEVNLN